MYICKFDKIYSEFDRLFVYTKKLLHEAPFKSIDW